MFAEALVKVTWSSKRHPLCVAAAVEAKAKGLVQEALALGIPRIVNHWPVLVPRAGAECRLPI